ncbi:MAG TPA: putative 2OG-Fe(II) oxygenase, partial [Methylovirgula sp.]
APLLEFCDALPATPFLQSRRLAFRAVALSRLGRVDEARALVDVARHVMVFRFDPPSEHGDAVAFNARLAHWLIANTGSVPTPRPDCVIDYGLTHTRLPLINELRSFVRRSFATYVAQLPVLGLGDLMPLPPAGELFDFVVFLHGNGRNGEHVHPNAYVVGVYYVQVPKDVQLASDMRGCLVLGACEKLTDGHQPAWGVRYLKPEPGMLVLFPAHMFHDVVPTQSAEPRIVIGADVRPAPRHA